MKGNPSILYNKGHYSDNRQLDFTPISTGQHIVNSSPIHHIRECLDAIMRNIKENRIHVFFKKIKDAKY